MSNSNVVGRTILDTRDVLNQKISEVLLTELVAPGHLDRELVASLAKKIQIILHEQTDQLIDRVLVSF